MNKRPDISAAILAGGKGTRLGGTDKAAIVVNGLTLSQRLYSTLLAEFEEVFIVGYKPAPGIPFVEDSFPDCGPLGGIFDALEHTRADACFIFSVDLLLPDINLIRDMKSHYRNEMEMLVPEYAAGLEPIHAIYSVSCKKQIKNKILSGGSRSVSKFIREHDADYFDATQYITLSNPFFNLNTLGDKKKAEELGLTIDI